MAKKNTESEAWERREGETSRQYEAFCTYRDMGMDRSQKKVSKELHKSGSLMNRWSVMNEWVERAAAYDAEQERLNRIEQMKSIKKMRREHALIASSMLAKASKALLALKPNDVKPSDISRMVEVASKLERISRGDVGEVVEERTAAEPATPAVQFYIPDNDRD